MSNLILPAGLQAVRPNRTARRAAQSKAILPAAAVPFPNMQRRARIAAAAGGGLAMGPAGPVFIVQLADGQQLPVPFDVENARQMGVGLISLAAQFEMLQKMQAEQAAASGAESVPLTPEMAELLAEAQGNTAGSSVISTDEISEGEPDVCRFSGASRSRHRRPSLTRPRPR